MADRLTNAAPVGPVGGFPERNRNDVPKRHQPPASHDQPETETDGVSLHAGPCVARRLLRQRVLSRTRHLLELSDSEFVPRWAEAVDYESIATFLGRLLGAQNQLAALRVNTLPALEIRKRLDAALRLGTTEVLEMLGGDPKDGPRAVEVVADVLAEYGRRLAELALDP